MSPLQGATFSESDVKAAHLYYLFHFISWPAKDATDNNTPVKFCTLGESLICKKLEIILASPQAVGIPAEVSVISQPQDAADCDYIFIDSQHSASISSVLAYTDGKSILTVSDSKSFTDTGGMIELKRESNHIIVKINLESLSAHGLKASSKLLNLAEITSTSNYQEAKNAPSR